MGNYIIAFAMFIGMTSGYFLGNWQGKRAQEALEEVANIGKESKELQSEIVTSRDTDLTAMKAKFDEDTRLLDEKFADQTKVLEQNKSQYADTLRRKDNDLKETNKLLKDFQAKPLSVENKQMVAALEIKRDEQQRELNGSLCLTERVPSDRLSFLQDSNTREATK